MRKITPIKYKILIQGGPIINNGSIVAAGKNVSAVEIDMCSKRCNVFADSIDRDGSPVIWLDGEGALHLKEGKENTQTEVKFPTYKGWRIFSADISRYTFRICFVKNFTPS